MHRLREEQEGDLRIARLAAAWMQLNTWTYGLMADLSEVAQRHQFAEGVPDAAAREYQRGEVMIHAGQVWIAKRRTRLVEAGDGELNAPSLKRAHEFRSFRHVRALNLLQKTVLHRMLVSESPRLRPRDIAAFACLNRFCHQVQLGAEVEADERLMAAARTALLVRDADGVAWGPAQWFSRYTGDMESPLAWLEGLEETERDATVRRMHREAAEKALEAVTAIRRAAGGRWSDQVLMEQLLARCPEEWREVGLSNMVRCLLSGDGWPVAEEIVAYLPLLLEATRQSVADARGGRERASEAREVAMA